MRLALLIAPSDPRAGDAASRRESLGWLRGQFARAKFDVAIVGAAQSPEEAVAKAAGSIRAGDTVIVHLSGRLIGREELAFGGGRSASLSRLREALAARHPAELSLLADFTYEDDPSAPATAEERLAWAVGALGAASHGHAVLAAVRRVDAATVAAGRMAFTRVAMSALPPTDRNAPPQSVESLLAAMHATAMGLPEGRTAADHVVLRPGASANDLAPRVAEFAVVSVPLAVGSPPRGDAPGAVEGLLSAAAQLAVEPLPSSPPLAATLDDIEAAASRTPMHAPLYASAYEIHLRDGNTDLAVLAAMALEQLEAAAVEQRALVGRFRSVAPVRARAPLDAEAWALLQAPGFDDVISALFAAVEGAAIAVALEDGDERKHPETDREHRLSETSTASVVRTFQWAARFLGVPCPHLYAVDDPPGILSIRAPEPSTVLGGAVLSGRSAKDLAFLAARHLTFYRPEHHVLLYYPTREALTALLFAAVQLGLPDSASTSVPAEVRALRSRLSPRVDDNARAALMRAVRVLDARGGQARIGAWVRSVELTAARAGLLLCGDLGTAAILSRTESRPVADLSLDQRRGDLVAFCASRAHAALRARFVVPTPESGMPPPLSGVERTVAAS
jgi:hypothetical protein